MYFSSAGFFKRDRTISLLKDVGTTDADSGILIIVVIVVGIGSSSQALHGAFKILCSPHRQKKGCNQLVRSRGQYVMLLYLIY